MSEWQIEIINLAKDFRVPKAIYKKIITNTQTHKIDTIPVSYHNNRNRLRIFRTGKRGIDMLYQ